MPELFSHSPHSFCVMKSPNAPIHTGRNISRIREIRGLKQDALAFAMGVSQQTVSVMENSQSIEDHKLEAVAKALEVSIDLLHSFSESSLIGYLKSCSSDINLQKSASDETRLLERLWEILQTNSRLQAEKESLYERLLQTEQEKSKFMEKLFISRISGINP